MDDWKEKANFWLIDEDPINFVSEDYHYEDANLHIVVRGYVSIKIILYDKINLLMNSNRQTSIQWASIECPLCKQSYSHHRFFKKMSKAICALINYMISNVSKH